MIATGDRIHSCKVLEANRGSLLGDIWCCVWYCSDMEDLREWEEVRQSLLKALGVLEADRCLLATL